MEPVVIVTQKPARPEQASMGICRRQPDSRKFLITPHLDLVALGEQAPRVKAIRGEIKDCVAYNATSVGGPLRKYGDAIAMEVKCPQHRPIKVLFYKDRAKLLDCSNWEVAKRVLDTALEALKVSGHCVSKYKHTHEELSPDWTVITKTVNKWEAHKTKIE